MQKLQDYFYQTPGFGHYVASFALLVLIAVSTIGYTSSYYKEFSEAASPTFSLSQSGNTLVVTIDGTSEGKGLLGTEVNITYDSKLIEFKAADFGTCTFDSCLDLSEIGKLKFFAASNLPDNGGKAVTTKEIFAKVPLTFLGKEAVTLDFTKCQVISEKEVVEDRTCTGLKVKKEEVADGSDAKCGNNKIETGEQCDDGNVTEGDGCSVLCLNEVSVEAPVCGNNEMEGVEECDDGNMMDDDGCSAMCVTEVMDEEDDEDDDGNEDEGEGAGEGDEGGDQADEEDAMTDDDEEGGGAQSICGNTLLETGEQCDDGNVTDGDGCSAACSEEAQPSRQLISIDMTMAINYPSTIQVGQTTILNSWAQFSDSDQLSNITSKVNYSNSNPATASLSGVTITGVAAGKTTVTASYNFEGVIKTDQVIITVITAPVVPPVCGNGRLEGTELCDDGNVTDGDGCSAMCATEIMNEGDDEDEDEGEGAEEGDEGGNQANEENKDATSAFRPAAASTAPSERATTMEQAIEQQAVIQAEEIIFTKEVIKKESVVIVPPKKEEVVTKLDLCKQRHPDLNFLTSDDHDQDGLSNKTECYASTNPERYDTDNDTCSDGAEINESGTNPNDSSDCGQTELPEEARVTITDPHAGWILRTLEVAGIVPQNTAYVTAVVFPADRVVIQDLISGLTHMKEQKTSEGILTSIDDLSRRSIPAAQVFLSEYGASYDYSNLAEVVSNLRIQLQELALQIQLTAEGAELFIPDTLILSLEQLQTLDKDPVKIGTVSELSDTEFSGRPAKKFFMTASEPLESNQAYDVVAIATLKDGSTRSSSPIRFGLDDAIRVSRPRPESIGNKLIPEGPTAFQNLWIGNVRADSLKDGVEIEINQLKPTVSGGSEFGSQVFAVWNSIVLASSVISDSEEGAFEIQAPKELETDIGHRVTLYAVKAGDSGQQARSESVNVFFRIKPMATGFSGALWAMAMLTVFGAITLITRRHLRQRKATVNVEQVAAVYIPTTEVPSAREAAQVFENAEEEAASPLNAEFEQAFKEAAEHQADETVEVPDVTPEEDVAYEKLEDREAEKEEELEKMHR